MNDIVTVQQIFLSEVVWTKKNAQIPRLTITKQFPVPLSKQPAHLLASASKISLSQPISYNGL
jgi:hypothetical protein